MNAIRLSTALATILAAGVCSAQATYQGLNINFNALPQQAIALINAGINPKDFALRLKAGGTVVLDGMDTVISPTSPTQKSLAFLALDRLEFRHGARIVTNGNTLIVFVNTLASDNGQIIAYDNAQSKASQGIPASGVGGAGNPGSPGGNGGLVSFHVIQGIEGQLHVRVSGQSGGDGSSGNQGGQGPQGSHGADAQDGPGGWLIPGWCKSGGQDGGIGGQGFPGGSGGSGGPGGDGGIFELYNVGNDPIPSADYDFMSAGGTGGGNGAGGSGGPGGPGGSGGSGSAWCGGGHGGPTGPQGNAGYTIPLPAHAGLEGQAIVKALTLELIINAATSPSSPSVSPILKMNHTLILHAEPAVTKVKK